jgi:hypothetical protein
LWNQHLKRKCDWLNFYQNHLTTINGYFYFIISVRWLIVRTFGNFSHEKSPGKRSQFFLLLDKKKRKKRPIDVADRLSIERGAADVIQVRVR